MKIIKYNLLLLEKQKLIYAVISALILFSLTNVLMVFANIYGQVEFIEQSKSADYLFALAYPFMRIQPITILGLPLLFSLLFADSTWSELKQGNSVFLYTRMDYIKNILIRYILNIIIVFLISCFGFLLNYISFSLIFGHGNAMTNFYDLAFLQETTDFFLDSIRNSNVLLYSLLLILHVSTIYSLLAGISYAISFLFKNRIMIYFSSILIIIIFELITMILKIGNLSIMMQLQPFSVFKITDALMLYLILFLFGIGILLMFLFKKKDLIL